jgi:hypothetical protein
MKQYRDTAVAHHDSRRREIPNFPRYDLALKSAYFYLARVRQLILDEKHFDLWDYPTDDLEAYSDKFSAQARTIAVAAVAATHSMREEVD